MSDNLRIAIIGCGKQAEKHISGFKNYGGVEIFLADIDQAAARRLGEAQGIQALDNVDDIFNDSGIDAVDICTPTKTHYPLIKAALESGKHVFCEKPLCENPGQAKAVMELEKQTGRFVMVGYIYRYAAAFDLAGRLFRGAEKDVLGKPHAAFFRIGGRGSHQPWKHKKETDGGAINEMLVHMLDLANYYFGPLSDIKLQKCRLFQPERVIQGQVHKVDAEDYVLVTCQGEQGAEISINADLISAGFVQFMEVQAENGGFMGSIKPDFPCELFLKNKVNGYSAGKNNLELEPVNLYNSQMAIFCDAVKTNGPLPFNTTQESLAVMEVVEEILKQRDELCTK